LALLPRRKRAGDAKSKGERAEKMSFGSPKALPESGAERQSLLA